MTILLPCALAAIAALFAAIGQAGGAGYLAVLAVSGQPPDTIRPTALLLTVLVAGIGVIHFHRLRLLAWRDCWPFAVLGVPGAVLGGMTVLPPSVYRVAVAALMLATSVQMLRTARGDPDATALEAPPLVPAILSGGVIGLMAGITGIGGGIFIMPLVLVLRWATAKRAAALAQVNNIYIALAGLLGVGMGKAALPAALPWWALAAAAGGAAGAWFGTRHLPAAALRLILAAILLASAVKLLAG